MTGVKLILMRSSTQPGGRTMGKYFVSFSLGVAKAGSHCPGPSANPAVSGVVRHFLQFVEYCCPGQSMIGAE